MPNTPDESTAKTERGRQVLLVCTGSVGAVKVPEIICSLSALGFDVRYICSSSAASHFLNKANYYNPSVHKKFMENKYNEKIIEDKDEWTWDRIGDPVLHIMLRDWADLLIVVPASADIIAKISNGICDTLALSVCRAWNFEKSFILCPAMNTHMFNHPVTQQSLDKLQTWGCTIIEPVDKLLACGDLGKGALCSVDDIVKEVISVRKKLNTFTDYSNYKENNIQLDDILTSIRKKQSTDNQLSSRVVLFAAGLVITLLFTKFHKWQ